MSYLVSNDSSEPVNTIQYIEHRLKNFQFTYIILYLYTYLNKLSCEMDICYDEVPLTSLTIQVLT